jgi:hypothetical protein
MTRQLGHVIVVSILSGGAMALVVGCAGLVGADFGDYEKSAASADRTRDPSEPAPSDSNPPGPAKEDDGGSSVPPKPDGDAPKVDATTPAKKCQGTATTCSAYATDMTNCQAQDGCTWQTPLCKLTTSCSQFQTNQQCQNAPGCATDFTTSTCKAIAGYCSGTTKSACETKSSCAFTGGCAGSATACGGLSEASCKVQAGCTWQ